jgi:chromosome transmission fidelity protein 4
MYDSDGMLSILDRSRRRGQARWTPLVDTKALVKKEGGNQTSYWPVGVNDSRMMCVILKVSARENCQLKLQNGERSV